MLKNPFPPKDLALQAKYHSLADSWCLYHSGHKVSVSSKIKSGEERARLKQLIQSITPKNFGVIVRTVAEGKRVAELDAEMKVLLSRWNEAITRLQKTQETPSTCV